MAGGAATRGSRSPPPRRRQRPIFAEAEIPLESIITATDITKTFPGVRALDRVEFGCQKGEVHALIGENGAGKSTLMKIIAGVYRPDEGVLTVRGEKVDEFSPQHAQEQGIAIIYQELSLLPYLSVAENIFLGREPQIGLGLVDYAGMERRAAEILGQLDPQISPRTPVHWLPPAQRQLVEIAKALSLNADVIIMDEPSSSLADHELQRLFEIIRTLKEKAVTVVYISHRLEEVMEIADQVTVLRDGQRVGCLPIAEVDEARLIQMMVGRDVAVPELRRDGQEKPVVMEVKGLTRQGVFKDVNLTLHRGEILGLAGLIGSGRTDLARAIFGADPVDAGSVSLSGKPVHLSAPRAVIDQGIALIPEDRKTQGLILTHTLRENVALPSLKLLQRIGFVKQRAERKMVSQSIDRLNIRTPGMEQQVAYLSGGNQQKVVLAKWLNAGPDVLIFDEPTRGIDVGAKAEIYTLLRQLADSGTTIMMISSELPEILNLSDRIAVMSGGEVVGELNASEATEEKVLALAYRNVTNGFAQKVAPAAAAEALPEASALTRARLWFNAFRESPIAGNAIGLAILVVLFLIGALGSDRFLSMANMTNLLRQIVIPVLLGIGQTLVILSGGIDLSVSSIVTVSNVLAAGLMAGQDQRVIPVALLCLGVGLVAGAANALIILKLRVIPIIATLATMVMLQGAALLYTREPIGVIPRAMAGVARGRIGPIPTATIFMLLIVAVAAVLLYRARYGRHLYAVGGDDQIARLSGISINRVRAVAYIISGGLAALTGLYLTSRMGSGDPSVGPGLELDSIAAVLLGGTVLGGGRGGLLGTIVGVLVLVLLSNVFNQLGLHIWYQQIAKGFIIVLAVAVYRRTG